MLCKFKEMSTSKSVLSCFGAGAGACGKITPVESTIGQRHGTGKNTDVGNLPLVETRMGHIGLELTRSIPRHRIQTIGKIAPSGGELLDQMAVGCDKNINDVIHLPHSLGVEKRPKALYRIAGDTPSLDGEESNCIALSRQVVEIGDQLR